MRVGDRLRSCSNDYLGLANDPRLVPLIVGASDAAVAVSQALEGVGFLVTAIRPPTVPPGTARIRVTFTAAHSDDDVLRLAATVRAVVPPVR